LAQVKKLHQLLLEKKKKTKLKKDCLRKDEVL
jgi:hypothetical protein